MYLMDAGIVFYVIRYLVVRTKNGWRNVFVFAVGVLLCVLYLIFLMPLSLQAHILTRNDSLTGGLRPGFLHAESHCASDRSTALRHTAHTKYQSKPNNQFRYHWSIRCFAYSILSG